LKIQTFTWHSKNKNIFDHTSSKLASFEFTTNANGSIVKASNSSELIRVGNKVLLVPNESELDEQKTIAHIKILDGKVGEVS
jgi:hypothetical protein